MYRRELATAAARVPMSYIVDSELVFEFYSVQYDHTVRYLAYGQI